MKRTLTTLAVTIAIAVALNLAIGFLVTPVGRSNHRYLLEYRDWLHKTKAEVVLIGNSMLNAGIDSGTLTHLLQRPCIKLAKGGSASAAWYLTFKNVVVPAKPKPMVAVIFFRDIFLTHPTFRVRGRYRSYIEDLSVGEEPKVQELAFEANRLERFLGRTIPAYDRRRNLVDRLDRAIKNDLVAGMLGLRDGAVNAAIGRVFDDKNMLPEIATREQNTAEATEDSELNDFHRNLPSSFLPHIVTLAEQAGIKLILVRIRRRSHAMGTPDKEALKAYIRDLRAYLGEHRIPLLDFSREGRIELRHFARGDHLDKSGRRLFTQLLAQDLRPLLPRKSRSTRRGGPRLR